MKVLIPFQPLVDYWRTRRHPLHILAFPIFFAGGIFLYLTYTSINSHRNVDAFINIQINVVAILVSFSIASIAIIVSSDSQCLKKLRQIKTIDMKRYRDLDGKALSLFQILLSNIAYNIIVEIIYLILLLFQFFLKELISESCLQNIITIDVFFIIHILCVLIASVTQIYLTFWASPFSQGDAH